MTLENTIRLMAGSLILISLSLGYFGSHYWFLLTAFVGFNLIQSSITKFCPAEIIISRLILKNK